MSEDRPVRKVVALLNDCRVWWAEYIVSQKGSLECKESWKY